jgi:hypothetical protein
LVRQQTSVRAAALAAVICLVIAASGSAQTSPAAIAGTVRDNF